MAYETIDVKPLSPIIGAEIEEDLPHEGVEAAKFLEQNGRAP